MFFRDVVGQKHIKEHLIRTVKESRISHAQLFLGPEGCGKLAMAIAYSQYINCENRHDEDSCGECSSCRLFNKLFNPDLHFLYPITSTKEKPISKNFLNEWRNIIMKNDGYVSLEQWYEAIEIENKQGIINAQDCNEVIKILNMKAYQSEYKIIIIWMAEKLYHSAAPKLLKILEEPYDKTLFILIAENYDQILNTISSRTQLVKIPKLNEQDMFSVLCNKYQINPALAKKVSHLADGNFLNALTMANDVYEKDEQVEQFRKWMLMCYGMKIQELIDWIDKFSKIGREKIKQFLEIGINVVRASVLLNYGVAEIAKVDAKNTDFINSFSKILNVKNTYQIVEEFNTAMFHIERNGNPKVIFMDLSIKINKLFNLR